MCIIAIYKKGVKPRRDRVEEMMKRNADGVGIAWNNGKNVYFKKGITTAAQAWDILQSLDGRANDIVFHARIATSGGISAGKCHPFPLTDKNESLDAVNYRGKNPVVFHNGVFSIDIEKGLNDSQTFIKYALTPLYKADAHGVKNGAHDELIDMSVKGSRLVILFPDGLRIYGRGWETDDGGTVYSNTSYKTFNYNGYYNGAYYYNGYIWDDEDGWTKATPKKKTPAPVDELTKVINRAQHYGQKVDGNIKTFPSNYMLAMHLEKNGVKLSHADGVDDVDKFLLAEMVAIIDKKQDFGRIWVKGKTEEVKNDEIAIELILNGYGIEKADKATEADDGKK